MRKLNKQIFKNRVKKRNRENLPGQRKYTYVDILQEKNREKWNKNI